MRTLVRMALLVVVVGLLAAPASMAAGEKNALRFGLGYFTATGDLTSDVLDVSGRIKYQGAVGAGVGYEHRFDDLIGLDFGFKYFQPDVELSSSGVSLKESGKFMPLTAGVMFHVAKSEKVDFYLGPELAYVMYGDVTLDVLGLEVFTAKFKDDLTFGVKLGADFAMSPKWAINASVEYLDAKSEVDTLAVAGIDIPGSGGDKLDPKPIILMVGATYKF